MRRYGLIGLWCILVLSVLGCGGGGNSGIPVTITLGVNPDTPGQTSLSWTAHTDVVSSYDIYRNGTKINSTLPPATFLNDFNLLPNTQYCYVIQAVVFPLGVVGSSNQVCITTPDITHWPMTSLPAGKNISLNLDNANMLHISFRNATGVRYLTNISGQWVTSDVDSNAGGFGKTGIAVTPTGQAHVSYYDYMNDDLRYGNNSSGVWVTELLSDAGGYTNAIALDVNGFVHISAVVNAPVDHSLVYITNRSGNWVTTFLMSYSNNVQATELRIDSSGYAHIAYAVGDGLCTSSYVTNRGGTWSDTVLDTSAQCGISLDLDSNDIPHIVYMKANELIYTTNSSGGWVNSSVDTLSWIGGMHLAIDLDSSDGIHISYRDNNADLKYASGVPGFWQSLYLDGTGDLALESVLKVDAAATVNILYTDDTNGTLKLVTSP